MQIIKLKEYITRLFPDRLKSKNPEDTENKQHNVMSPSETETHSVLTERHSHFGFQFSIKTCVIIPNSWSDGSRRLFK